MIMKKFYIDVLELNACDWRLGDRVVSLREKGELL